MKLGIMQPYFFPYIGYWRLISAVDRFVIYDDVNFIKGGWVNRNRILINGEPRYITVPLSQASPYKKIYEIATQTGGVWRNKLLKTIQNTYRRAPFYSEGIRLCEDLISHNTDNLSELLVNQIVQLTKILEIDTEIIPSSQHYGNNELLGQNRVIDICKAEQASMYINPPGGEALYTTVDFSSHQIDLRFLNSKGPEYSQRSPGFVPDLSIIDLIMELGLERLKSYLDEYSLYKKSN